MAEKSKAIPEINVGVLGYGFMGKAFSNGFLQMPHIYWPPPAIPRLLKICGRNENKVKIEAERLGFKEYCTEWFDLVTDERIDLFVNCGPNNIHAAPCIEAARKGKHVLCDKPLGMNAMEAKDMLIAAQNTKIKHICNFIFRTIPALVKLRDIISSGKFGEIFHFRGTFLADYSADADAPVIWRNKKDIAGSGVSGDLSTHLIDLARFLCGGIDYVIGQNKTFVKDRPTDNGSSKRYKIDVDDNSICILGFKNGASGTIESSSVCHGHRASVKIEINAENGSAYWSFEQMNSLYLYLKKDAKGKEKGFKIIKVTDNDNAYYDKWSDFGTVTGINYMNLFVNMVYGISNLIIKNSEPYSKLATFEDGYIANIICDAIEESSKSGKRIKISY